MSIATAERLASVSVTSVARRSRSRPASSPSRPTAPSSSAPGDTMVLATAQGRTEAREGADFFPLTVDVEERMYAAGKIPGGFFKREGRPTERAILTARMIDRPIRPLWPKGFKNEVQVHRDRALGRPGHAARHPLHQRHSAALMISPLPFLGPVGRRSDRLIDGELVVNPTLQESEDESDARPDRRRHEGRPDDGRGRRDEIPDEKLLEAFELAHAEIRKLCEAQEDLRRQAGKPKWLDPELTAELEREHGHTIWERIQEHGLREAGAIVEELVEELAPPLSMESTDEDIVRQLQVRPSLDLLLEQAAARRRRRPGPRAVRVRAARADGSRAGLEGAASRRSARCSSTGSSRAWSCRSRSARRPSTARRRSSRTR